MAFQPTSFRTQNAWTADLLHGQRQTPIAAAAAVPLNTPPEPEPEPEPEAEPQIDVEALRAELLAEARTVAQQEVAAALEAAQQTGAALSEALDAVSELRVQALSQAADDVGVLIIALSRRLLDQSLAVHPEALPGLVRQALEQLPESESVEVHVSPGMMEQVSRALNANCKLVADPDIGGGVTVRTRHVSLDATVDAAMNGVDAAVKTWLSEQPWVTDWMLQ